MKLTKICDYQSTLADSRMSARDCVVITPLYFQKG